ncbi:MAG: hypothetical protein ACREX9_16510, partial [Gammaproteobacteria bacterium]
MLTYFSQKNYSLLMTFLGNLRMIFGITGRGAGEKVQEGVAFLQPDGASSFQGRFYQDSPRELGGSIGT